ncbi:hypothetical protein BHM03_00030824, partial [Ensete ventricosum]
LYRAVTVGISIVTTWYKSVTVNFDRRHLLWGDISQATAWLQLASYDEGRSKRKRENLRRCCPLTTRQRLDCRRRLRLKNLGMALQLKRTSRGNDFFIAVFYSSEATRKRGKHR